MLLRQQEVKRIISLRTWKEVRKIRNRAIMEMYVPASLPEDPVSLRGMFAEIRVIMVSPAQMSVHKQYEK